MKEKLTQKYLKECLTYDPETGIFTWNERPLSHFESEWSFKVWNAQYPGRQTGNLNCRGYISICIKSKVYSSHRLAFLYMEGYMPENFVDHIDRNRTNNKWSNLREASHQCNMQNCSIQRNNTSGVSGVWWDKDSEKWQSKIMAGGKRDSLGLFKNFDDAVMARYQAELNNPLWTCSVESTAYKYLKERNLI